MKLSRRNFLNSAAALSGVSVVGPGSSLGPGGEAAAQAAWPSAAEWAALNRKVGGRLVKVASPVAACRGAAGTAPCKATLERFKNPFWIQDQPGGLQTNGWLDAWSAEISPYAVAAERAADIAAAVDFAREHRMRLVIKGAGHDYKGRNCAPGSLLVWTHRMRDVVYHDRFRITGGPATAPAVSALTVGAGTRWIEAYQKATANRRYVQGGGCTSVGAAGGFIQGGGYGSFSKRFGTGAGNVLEFEVVTADGTLRIANEAQNPDLFWALRGGGGGTFGIVTKATLLAHEMPKRVGLLRGRIAASGDGAFRDLLARLVAFYPGALNNPHWGEQIAVRPDNSIELFMTYLDLESDEARAVWRPLTAGLAERPKDFRVDMRFETHDFENLWNDDYWKRVEPTLITSDARPDAAPAHFWWTTNQGEVAEFIYTYQSRWLPLDLFQPANAAKTVRMLFDASRHAPVGMQINKGLAGAPADVLARERKTSVHPDVREAAAIVIIAARKSHSFPGIAGFEPDLKEGRATTAAIDRAMRIIRDATPGVGTYGNESDYFEKDWKTTFYGPHYDRLLAIKKKYDPTNLFKVHHGVGSDL